jgi:hypothetical protein
MLKYSSRNNQGQFSYLCSKIFQRRDVETITTGVDPVFL